MKEVENLAQFDAPRPVGPNKQQLVIRADDGDCYEWSRFRDDEAWSFEAKVSPDGSRSTRRSRLPLDVKWCISVLEGLDGWKY